MNKVVNLFAGPGTGKSTTCAALFAELKYQGYNTEMILEYAKGAAWENRGDKIFKAQEYIFGKQSFYLSRVVEEVNFVITDSPLLQGIIYIEEGYLPSLKTTIIEAFNQYDNLNILLKRNKPYNPKGRLQTEDKAKSLDDIIEDLLKETGVKYYTMDFDRYNVTQIITLMGLKGWI